MFYKLFIPAVLGGMAVLVVLDIGSIFSRRFGVPKKPKAGRHEKKPEEKVEPPVKEASQAGAGQESDEDRQHG